MASDQKTSIKVFSDDLPFPFRILDALQTVQKNLPGIDRLQGQSEFFQIPDNLFGFAHSHQSVVDIKRLKSVSQRLVAKEGRHRGVDASRKGADEKLFSNSVLNMIDFAVDITGQRPVWTNSGDICQKRLQKRNPLEGLCHFRMELHPVKIAIAIFHGCDRGRARSSGFLKTGRQG